MSKPAKPAANKQPAEAKKAPLVGVTLKMSAAQHEKLKQLGGSQWVLDRIDEAKI